MSNLLLLISTRPEDLAFAQGVATTAAMSLQCVPTAAEGARVLAENSPKAVLVDSSTEELYQSFESAVQEAVGLFSEKVDPNAIHFLTGEPLEKSSYLIQSPLFGNFVLRAFADPVEDGKYYGQIVRATLLQRAFGLENLLRPGSKIQTVKLQSSMQKQGAVEAIRNYLLAARFQSRMAGIIANAVDEILMNAIFDAPVDELGRQRFSSLARSTAIKLEGRHVVEAQIGFDGSCVGITAVDNFGSLDKGKLMSHLSKAYRTEEYKVKTSVAGAGIGLATVFRSGGSFLFASEKEMHTEVTVLFRRAENFRKFREQFRFIASQFYF